MNNGLEGLYFARPVNTKKFHIFKDSRSLCGKWVMFGKDESQSTNVFGDETLGQEDCKACFTKMKKTTHSNDSGDKS